MFRRASLSAYRRYAVSPLPAGPGKPAGEDYHYERNGVCALMTAFEPLTGRRFVEIGETGTERDYAVFTDRLADKHYPYAEKIRVVQDNLNTHGSGSFHSAFGAEKAFGLSQRSGFHHTPTKAGCN